MRALAVLVLLSSLATPGCLEQGGPAATADENPADTPAANTTRPPNVIFQGSLVGQGDVSSNAPCALADAQCVNHVVTVPAGEWDVTFTLVGTDGTVTSQGVPYNTDYDLFVDGVGESTNPGGQADIVTGHLKAGDYTAQVVAWHDVDGTYTLTASFS